MDILLNCWLSIYFYFSVDMSFWNKRNTNVAHSMRWGNKHRPRRRPQFGKHAYTNTLSHICAPEHIPSRTKPLQILSECPISSPAGILWRTMFAQSDGDISDLGECLELQEAASWSPALFLERRSIARADAATASSSSQAENCSSAAVMSSRRCRCSLYIRISARTQRCAHPKALDSQRGAEDEWIGALTPETQREWHWQCCCSTATSCLVSLRPGRLEKNRSNNADIIWLWIRRRWDSSCIEVSFRRELHTAIR